MLISRVCSELTEHSESNLSRSCAAAFRAGRNVSLSDELFESMSTFSAGIFVNWHSGVRISRQGLWRKFQGRAQPENAPFSRTGDPIVGRKVFPELYLAPVPYLRSSGRSIDCQSVDPRCGVGLCRHSVSTVRAQQTSFRAARRNSRPRCLNTYCVTCHNDKARTGGFSLEKADLTDIPKDAETWEKVIRKVRVGMMPPPGAPRPDSRLSTRLSSFSKPRIDRAAAAKPNPGHVVMHRLNRAEYANAIRDLLALDIDATALLPPDDESSGFDNIADVLKVSPSLMERYLSASWNISRMAVGNPAITPSTAPIAFGRTSRRTSISTACRSGTRGGILVDAHVSARWRIS